MSRIGNKGKGMNIKLTTETELCQKFIEAHPRKEHLYFEVYGGGGRFDIVHKERVVTIYEAKLSLNIKVLEQCINAKRFSNYTYAVVHSSGKNFFLKKLFKDFGIGIISIRVDGSHYNGHTPILFQESPPVLNRHNEKLKLYEENKKESPGGKIGGVTPFGIMVKNLKHQIARTGKVTIDDAFHNQSYYGTPKQFKANIYQWIRSGVIEGIEMEKGILTLAPATHNPQ